MKRIIFAITVLFTMQSFAAMAPDGTYVSGDSYTMAPDGSYY